MKLKRNRINTIDRKSRYIGKADKIRFGIRTQLIIGFIIPISFVIIIGVISYQKASSGLNTNYEESTMKAIDMAVQYFDFGFKAVEADAMQLVLSKDAVNYTNETYKDDSIKKNKALDSLKTTIYAKAVSNEFIQGIYLITKDNLSLLTTSNIIRNGFYDEVITSTEGQLLNGPKASKYWIGNHEFIDKEVNASKDDYACSLMYPYEKNNACVVIDVKRKVVQDVLTSLNLGNDSILAFITADGRELMNQPEEFSFLGKDFYQEKVSGKENSGSKYINFNGDTYLFMYSRSVYTGASICALVPKSLVMTRANEIKTVTIILVALACIIAITTGSLLSVGIVVNINKITKKLSIASKGDLTVKIDVNNKNEIGILADDVMETIENTRNLIKKVKDVTELVAKSSEVIAFSSETMEQLSGNIFKAMEDIDQGITQQVDDSQNCLTTMDKLSGKIEVLGDNTNKIEVLADKTKTMIHKSINTMVELTEQTKSTSKNTKEVVDSVNIMEEKNKTIEKFIDTINDIASQTDLLSLNASIEAARAGAAGSGFSVVAEEIRKLAEKSLNASRQIQSVISEIKQQTQGTVTIVKQAADTVDIQEGIVRQTIVAFQDLNLGVDELLTDLNQISGNIVNLDIERKDTLFAIENISAVIEETSACSNSVSNTVQEQNSLAISLKSASIELGNRTQELNEAIHMFTIE